MSTHNMFSQRNNININNVYVWLLTLLLLNTTCPVLANSIDPDQLASDLALHCVIKYVNFYQKPVLNNLTGCKLEVGVAS